MVDHTEKTNGAGNRQAPRYVAIEEQLAQAIRAKTLPPGLVVTEDPLARLFGTSRTPVRKAFNQLALNGLLERFEGRGFIVSGASEPRREPVTREMLGLSNTTATKPPRVGADRIARAFEASLAQALPFGQFRVNEQAAADHFEVSRTIIRELLNRFQDRGLVRKDLKSHWVVGPLTALDIQHYFAIRSQLEPLALQESARLFTPEDIAACLARVQDAIGHKKKLKPLEIEELETDLHVKLLSKTPNRPLLRMIRQSQIALSVNQVFAETVGSRPFNASLTEHSIVMEFLLRGSWDAAGQALKEHLHLSAARTRERLMSFSVFPEPVLAGYLRPFQA